MWLASIVMSASIYVTHQQSCDLPAVGKSCRSEGGACSIVGNKRLFFIIKQKEGSHAVLHAYFTCVHTMAA